jgi:hypothetical protein
VISRETGEQRWWVCDHADTPTCAALIAENLPAGRTWLYTDVTAFPTIQILSVKDWFEGRTVKLPTDTVNPFRQAAMKADQERLF